MKKKRIGRNDIFFFAALGAVVVGLFLWIYIGRQEIGASVEVTVDGNAYGTYLLSQDQEAPILINGRTANLLVIIDGKAVMKEADCPDRLCVRQRAVSKTNEMIVCLPNKVVVQVIGAKESEFDSIAK